MQLAGLPLQTSPAGQLAFAPSVLVHPLVLVPGMQHRHGFAGFAVPDVTLPALPVSHCVPHCPLLQT